MTEIRPIDDFQASRDLITDPSGNILGIDNGEGQPFLFEIANTASRYSSTAVRLASFDSSQGTPNGDLHQDSAGNLFGTTSNTVYEITKTATSYSTPITLSTIGASDGTSLNAGLALDAAGNLFGTTASQSAGGGTIFEVVNPGLGHPNLPVELAALDGATIGTPFEPLTVDSQGNLIGEATLPTTGAVTIFEIAKNGTTTTGYSDSPSVIASIDTTATGDLSGPLVADSDGNLFGTTYGDATDNAGTVFEIAKTTTGYSNTAIAIATFGIADSPSIPHLEYPNGAQPSSPLIVDAAGNLFGVTQKGGNYGLHGAGAGTVFEIAKTATGYDSTPIVVAAFDGEGANPYGGLIADASGNLLGSTGSGEFSASTIFEITDSGYQTAVTPCYCSGTHILTDKGEMAVEDLRIGDHVLTASGERRPIRWIGRRNLDLTRHPDPRTVWPVRIEAGAFGAGIPSRDLWVSPGHAVLVGEKLVQACRILNGASIAQVKQPNVTYWHIELDSHDILLAEGLPAESYLDTGNRTAFAGGGAFLDLHPDFKPKRPVETCVPLALDGPELHAIKSHLLRCAVDLGYGWGERTRPYLLADGMRIMGIGRDQGGITFRVPKGAKDIRLVSNIWTPALAVADSLDDRLLGVCVTRLEIDGREISLDDAMLAEGWNPVEYFGGRPQRWTSGRARLPAGASMIAVDLIGGGRYLAERSIDAHSRRRRAG